MLLSACTLEDWSHHVPVGVQVTFYLVFPAVDAGLSCCISRARAQLWCKAGGHIPVMSQRVHVPTCPKTI